MTSLRNRIVPYSVSYDKVSLYAKRAEIILYISTVLSLFISTLDYFDTSAVYKERIQSLKTVLILANSILISFFVFFDIRGNYIFTKAEMKRRLDYLDNSFGTNFSGKKSENYFTNENLSPGFYKLTINCFENSHHTEFIINKMFNKIMWQTIIIVILFIISAYAGNREVVRMFFELILPLALIQKLIKASFYTMRMETVVENFKSLFNSLIFAKFDDNIPQALRDVLYYETTLSWASIPLDSDLFNKYKDELSKSWEDLKKEYQINNV